MKLFFRPYRRTVSNVFQPINGLHCSSEYTPGLDLMSPVVTVVVVVAVAGECIVTVIIIRDD
ncbi:MAG: hypothetical protein QXK69_06745 [Candidatus Caldarchaeum sp.]